MLKKPVIMFLITLMFIGGCTEPIGGDYFFNKVQSLEDALRKEDWQSANSQLKDMKNLYKKYFWRLQLLGDESEYEGLSEAISRLSMAIKIEDSRQALLELATIRASLKEIYSM